MTVTLAGRADPRTGLVVNVFDIDRIVREHAVPLFSERVRSHFRQGRSVDFAASAKLCELARGRLADKFLPSELAHLALSLDPFREISVTREDSMMIHFSEKFEFAAMHRLWNKDLPERENIEIFGKCANPSGHGHNYVLEVKVKVPAGNARFSVGGFERLVKDNLLKLLDHKNLNADVAEFASKNPTIENIAGFAWKKLAGKFGSAKLHCVTVWETDRTSCSCFG
jgi:6-pyruvoyltetrahydropterin/6-carboxytetrahydropterin synthase